ncbi:hypothetical protein BV898_09259 [Hypsibius exemplaris]|uniref:Chromo domain-containing protein n=1 Tax=Hypsibius exemplaris TaxID=2072580 RepID=A0A1W0WN22_HYPEX|nr:hypothetical protein BV898_09259 [Hypsibius exemplaris]
MPTATAALMQKHREREERTGIYTVGEILDEKFEDSGEFEGLPASNSINLYYLVHWKWFPHSEDSWEPQENLQSSKKALAVWAEKKLSSQKGPKRSKKSASPTRSVSGRRALPDFDAVEESIARRAATNNRDGDELGEAAAEPDFARIAPRVTTPPRTRTIATSPFASLFGRFINVTPTSSTEVPRAASRAITPVPQPRYHRLQYDQSEPVLPEWTVEDYLGYIPLTLVAVILVLGVINHCAHNL